MTLELRPNCEMCDVDLPPESPDARICTYECTFCARCVDERLSNVCPNCGGGFAPRGAARGHAAGFAVGSRGPKPPALDVLRSDERPHAASSQWLRPYLLRLRGRSSGIAVVGSSGQACFG